MFRKGILIALMVLLVGVSANAQTQNGCRCKGEGQCVAAAPKYLALSFDDGPTATTDKVLDVLEQYGLKASFFVIGNKIDTNTVKFMKRAVAMGCDIENHSWSHPFMGKLSKEEVAEEIRKTDEEIMKVTGDTAKFFRPPYLNVNDDMFQDIDKVFIGGTGCSDWVKTNTAQMRADYLLNNLRDGDIILLHDFADNDASVEALKIVIPALQERGFTLVTVPELFNKARQQTPDLHDGKIYYNAY